MNTLARIAHCVPLTSLAVGAHAATDFNVRAVLDNGDCVA